MEVALKGYLLLFVLSRAEDLPLLCQISIPPPSYLPHPRCLKSIEEFSILGILW